MNKFCVVCQVEHPIDEFGKQYENSLRPTIISPYCKKMEPLQPYQRYRIRRRNSDKEAFLKHNAELMKNYRDRHPEIDDYYNEKRRLDPDSKMRNGVINHAKSKNIYLNPNDIPVMTKKLSMPCFYCGYLDVLVALNGLDRIESDEGYTDENTVPACDTCNYMKHSYSISKFLIKINDIVKEFEMENISDVPDKVNGTFGKAKSKDGPKRAKSDKTMHLTVQEQTEILSNPCNYCGIREQIGIDRKNSELPYTVQNVVACCTMCNYMKKDLSPEGFIDQCLRIYLHQKLKEN